MRNINKEAAKDIKNDLRNYNRGQVQLQTEKNRDLKVMRRKVTGNHNIA